MNVQMQSKAELKKNKTKQKQKTEITRAGHAPLNTDQAKYSEHEVHQSHKSQQ